MIVYYPCCFFKNSLGKGASLEFGFINLIHRLIVSMFHSQNLSFKNEFDSLILVVSCAVYLCTSLEFDKFENNVCRINDWVTSVKLKNEVSAASNIIASAR